MSRLKRIQPIYMSMLGVLVKFLTASILIAVILQQHHQHKQQLNSLSGNEESALPIGDQLKRKARIMCIILTDERRAELYGKHTERTWVKDCDFPLYVSNNEHFLLEPVVFNTTYRWQLLRNALVHVHKHYLHEADWFLVLQDDNYVVMPNLRYMLYPYSSEQPIYFGYELLHPFSNETYMHDEGGYVLSKEALRRFVTRALPKNHLFRRDPQANAEKELSRCLRHVGVQTGENRDRDGGLRILPVRIVLLLNATYMLEHYKHIIENSPYEYKNGTVKLSKHVAIFARVDHFEQYELQFFLKGFHLFGVPDDEEVTLPPPASESEADASDTKEISTSLKVDKGVFNIFKLSF